MRWNFSTFLWALPRLFTTRPQVCGLVVFFFLLGDTLGSWRAELAVPLVAGDGRPSGGGLDGGSPVVATPRPAAPPSVNLSHAFFSTLLQDCSTAGGGREPKRTLLLKWNGNGETEKTAANSVEDKWGNSFYSKGMTAGGRIQGLVLTRREGFSDALLEAWSSWQQSGHSASCTVRGDEAG